MTPKDYRFWQIDLQRSGQRVGRPNPYEDYAPVHPLDNLVAMKCQQNLVNKPNTKNWRNSRELEFPSYKKTDGRSESPNRDWLDYGYLAT